MDETFQKPCPTQKKKPLQKTINSWRQNTIEKPLSNCLRKTLLSGVVPISRIPCQEQAHSRLPGAGMRYGAVERSFIIVCKQGVVAVQCLVKGPADKDIKHQMMGKIEVVILRWLWSLSRRMKLGKRPMIIWTVEMWCGWRVHVLEQLAPLFRKKRCNDCGAVGQLF